MNPHELRASREQVALSVDLVARLAAEGRVLAIAGATESSPPAGFIGALESLAAAADGLDRSFARVLGSEAGRLPEHQPESIDATQVEQHIRLLSELVAVAGGVYGEVLAALADRVALAEELCPAQSGSLGSLRAKTLAAAATELRMQ